MQNFFKTESQFFQWLLNLIFIVIFCVLVQTYLLPYGLALLAVLLITGWWFLRPLQIPPKVSLLFFSMSVVVVAGLIGNIGITQNLSATIESVMKWLVGLIVFATALRVSPSKQTQPLYWLGLLCVFVVMGFLSLLTWFVPSLRVLPDMNFLYATFGHNHFSSLLLLILPWFVLADQEWPSRYWKWIVVIWTVWLLSTFSRLGIVVGIGELSVLAFWLRSQQSWWHFLTRWLLTLIVIISIWSGLQIFGYQKIWCQQQNYVTSRVCKTWQSEQRPEYWRQAVTSIQHHAWFGTGLGTFDQVSLLYRKAPGSYSAHAHNDYVEWMTEAGWLGLVVSGLLWLVWWCYRPREIEWFHRATWLSSSALLVVGLFEFDLQFVVLFFGVLTALGWLVGWQHKSFELKKFTIEFKILRGWLTVLSLIVLLWASIFLWLNFDWKYKGGQQVSQFGHYYSALNLVVVQRWSTLDESQQSKMITFWQHNYRVLDSLMQDQADHLTSQQKERVIGQMYVINPWSRQNYDLARLQFDRTDYAAVRQTLAATNEFARANEQSFGVTLSAEADELRWRQALQYRGLAEWEIQQGDVLRGLADLTTATHYEPWILNDDLANYCRELKIWVRNQYNSDPVWQARWSEALELFDTINPAYLSSCGTDLSQMALEQLQVQLQHQQCHDTTCVIWQQRALQWSNAAVWVTEYLARLRTQFPTQQF